MTITLYHHPFSRSASVLWMLEETGVEHEVKYVDLKAGGQKAPEMLALNPMGKLPVLVDGDLAVTETTAIGMYLADRYAPGRLAPALDDPRRGTYFRWCSFSASVIEPGLLAKAASWEFTPSSAGWGEYEAMLTAMQSAIGDGPYLLGETFSMADIVFGATVRFMLRFNMLEPRPAFTAYVDRLNARPALKKADARNQEIAKANGLEMGG